MYPNYNFINQPLFQGQQMQPFGQQTQMPPATPPMLGQGFMQQPQGMQQPQQPQQHPGFMHQMGPMFGLMGMLGGSAPYAALGGITGLLLHKAKVF